MSFNNNLILLRKESGYSQKELASLVGVTQQCVSEWEKANIEPTLGFLWKLADIFSISIDELVGRDPL